MIIQNIKVLNSFYIQTTADWYAENILFFLAYHSSLIYFG